MTSYSRLVATMALFCFIFEILTMFFGFKDVLATSGHSVNCIGCQFNGASSSSLVLLLSRLCILKHHLTSLVFLFLAVFLVFLCHLSPLTSYKFLALILSSVLALSSFRAAASTIWNFIPDSIRSSDTFKFQLFRRHLKPHFFRALLVPPNGKLQRLRFICD